MTVTEKKKVLLKTISRIKDYVNPLGNRLFIHRRKNGRIVSGMYMHIGSVSKKFIENHSKGEVHQNGKIITLFYDDPKKEADQKFGELFGKLSDKVDKNFVNSDFDRICLTLNQEQFDGKDWIQVTKPTPTSLKVTGARLDKTLQLLYSDSLFGASIIDNHLNLFFKIPRGEELSKHELDLLNYFGAHKEIELLKKDDAVQERIINNRIKKNKVHPLFVKFTQEDAIKENTNFKKQLKIVKKIRVHWKKLIEYMNENNLQIKDIDGKAYFTKFNDINKGFLNEDELKKMAEEGGVTTNKILKPLKKKKLIKMSSILGEKTFDEQVKDAQLIISKYGKIGKGKK